MLVFLSCGDSEPGPVNGTVSWTANGGQERIDLLSAVFFEFPEPGAPNQLLLTVSSVKTDCDDARDGIIDNGGWPKRLLVLMTSDKVPGTYEAAITGAEGLTFAGELGSLGEQGEYDDLMVVSGTIQVDSIDASEMKASLDIALGDATDVPASGQLSGSFTAMNCGVYPFDL
jgi:hypothetical protein